jgi:hypothetical protein
MEVTNRYTGPEKRNVAVTLTLLVGQSREASCIRNEQVLQRLKP